jgi:hypothetical protein
MRAAVGLVTAAAFLLAGCSRAVHVPGEKLAPSSEWDGLYHVTTTTDQFTTRHFSVTDSTLVITKLGGSDKHYALIKLPVTIPLGEVKSVERLEHNDGQTAITVVAIVVVSSLLAVLLYLKEHPFDIE